MKDPFVIDLFIKIALIAIGSMFTILGGLLIWGIQKLAGIIFNMTQSNLTLNHEITAVKIEITNLKRYIEKTDKNEKDINNVYSRLERVEDKTENL